MAVQSILKRKPKPLQQQISTTEKYPDYTFVWVDREVNQKLKEKGHPTEGRNEILRRLLGLPPRKKRGRPKGAKTKKK